MAVAEQMQPPPVEADETAEGSRGDIGMADRQPRIDRPLACLQILHVGWVGLYAKWADLPYRAEVQIVAELLGYGGEAVGGGGLVGEPDGDGVGPVRSWRDANSEATGHRRLHGRIRRYGAYMSE